MSKWIKSILLLMIVELTLKAQSIDRSHTSTGGGELNAGGYTISTTIGEAITQTYQSDFIVNQGFQQVDLLQSVSITELNDVVQFLIYPNPAGDRLFIRSAFSENQSIQYALYATTGKQLQSGMLESGTETLLSLEALAGGMYYLQIFDAQKIYQTEKIIRQ